MPKLEIYKLKEREILSMSIPNGNNRVLLKTIEKNTEATTPSGILKISPTETDWNEANHASRWGEVVAFPHKLRYDPHDGSSLAWDTEVEVYKGMVVWYDYLDSLNCVTYFDEHGSEYKLIEYGNLYVGIIPVGMKTDKIDIRYHTKTEDKSHWVIPLNGYILFKKINKKPMTVTDIYIPDKNDPSKGIVKYISIPNKSYSSGNEDHIDLEEGDVCIFSHNYEVMLEHPTYAVFDGGRQYKRLQRRNVELVWRDDEIIIPKNRILIRQHPATLVTDYGLKLMRTNKTYNNGTVIISSFKEIKKDDEILFSKGSGRIIEWRGKTYRLLNISNVFGILTDKE